MDNIYETNDPQRTEKTALGNSESSNKNRTNPSPSTNQ